MWPGSSSLGSTARTRSASDTPPARIVESRSVDLQRVGAGFLSVTEMVEDEPPFAVYFPYGVATMVAMGTGFAGLQWARRRHESTAEVCGPRRTCVAGVRIRSASVAPPRTEALAIRDVRWGSADLVQLGHLDEVVRVHTGVPERAVPVQGD
jgi:hypothetical protein